MVLNHKLIVARKKTTMSAYSVDHFLYQEFRTTLSTYDIRFIKRVCKLFSLPPTGKNKAALMDMLSDFVHAPYQPIRNMRNKQTNDYKFRVSFPLHRCIL